MSTSKRDASARPRTSLRASLFAVKVIKLFLNVAIHSFSAFRKKLEP